MCSIRSTEPTRASFRESETFRVGWAGCDDDTISWSIIGLPSLFRLASSRRRPTIVLAPTRAREGPDDTARLNSHRPAGDPRVSPCRSGRDGTRLGRAMADALAPPLQGGEGDLVSRVGVLERALDRPKSIPAPSPPRSGPAVAYTAVERPGGPHSSMDEPRGVGDRPTIALPAQNLLNGRRRGVGERAPPGVRG